MTSRDAILQRVRTELSKGPQVPLPPVAEVWPRENLTPAALAERFTQELTAVHGEVIRCGTMADAKQKLAGLVREAGWTAIGAMDRPAVREAAADLPQTAVRWAAANWQPRQVAEFSASVIAAEALVADTGSCVVACPTAPDRLLCYLPPACVVIASVDQLAENLPAVWPGVSVRVADGATRGEVVILTGPSRTSDIEKILTLGVHGPKRLVVILID
ncbi:MAG: lactate utilization protein [Thermoguttaceae bacterium]